MKQGKNPTRAQKIKLKNMKLNPENWLIVRDDKKMLIVKHRISDTVRIRNFVEDKNE